MTRLHKPRLKQERITSVFLGNCHQEGKRSGRAPLTGCLLDPIERIVARITTYRNIMLSRVLT